MAHASHAPCVRRPTSNASGVQRQASHAPCVRRPASGVPRPTRQASSVRRLTPHASGVRRPMRQASGVRRQASGVPCVRRQTPRDRRPIQSPPFLLPVMTTTKRRHFPHVLPYPDLRPLSCTAWGNRVVLPTPYSSTGAIVRIKTGRGAQRSAAACCHSYEKGRHNAGLCS